MAAALERDSGPEGFGIDNFRKRWEGSMMADPMRGGLAESDCPYLWRQADVREQVIPGFCQDPLSGIRKIPGFWEYWNRCATAKHIVCRRYRRFRQSETAIQSAAPSSLRRSA